MNHIDCGEIHHSDAIPATFKSYYISTT